MPTATATPSETRLYPRAQWYFLAAIVTTWIGFSRSYFLRIGHATVYQHIHGATAGLWMTLLFVQPMLYQRGQLALHRRLGRLGVFVLLPALLMGGALMVHNMVKHQAGYPPGMVYTLSYLDAWSLLLLALFAGLAVRYAHDTGLHARYMSCTVLALLPPALTRALTLVPGLDSMTISIDISYISMVAILCLLVLDDRRQGRVRAAYPLAIACFAPMVLTMNAAGHWQWWHRLADRYAAF
ncbi:MAG: hypothetical protein JST61_06570 [Acidobacteria bacterium]|nr:hypothetical protein [Acidobacteriota bacterium]